MAQQTTATVRIESTLTNAIQDSGIRAISLFGPWGTGKTYVVAQFFKKKSTAELLKSHQCQFAYVSFFGLTSILEARQQLCLAALADPSKRVLSIFKRAGKALPTEVIFGGMSLDLSKLGSLGTNYIEDQALRDLVICIDDLERVPDSLKAREILGFISELSSKVLELVPEVKSADGPKIREVLKSLAGSESSWDPQQFQVLGTFTDDEIYHELINGHGDQFVFHLRRLLDRLHATPVENAKSLKPRLEAIAERISNLNAVSQFQVDLYIRPMGGPS